MKNQYNKRQVGSRYEKLTGAYLQSKGYRILEFNYRCRFGEIDIVAMHGECLVFCEVKYRKDASYQDPLEAIGADKQRVISRCAMYYLMKHDMEDMVCRFDVVGIVGDKVQVIQDAFYLD